MLTNILGKFGKRRERAREAEKFWWWEDVRPNSSFTFSDGDDEGGDDDGTPPQPSYEPEGPLEQYLTQYHM